MNRLDINQIKEYLPHRYPLLLVDRVLDYELDKSITAIKNVTVNEEFFNGHFPHKPGHAGRADDRSDGADRRVAGVPDDGNEA